MANQEPQLFYPPKQIPLLVRLVQSITYPLARKLYHFDLTVSETAVAKVKAIDESRLVYICNHPTLEDGIALFALSARVGQLFHYIVAHESFGGLLGGFIQRMGCYSIRRGLGDRASIAETLSLLKQPRCRLVIFPEGGCSYQNDTVMPFRTGAIQMPLQVMASLAKKEDEADLYIVPLSLKYRYSQPMERVIEETLSRLEAKLDLSPDTAEFYPRLRAVAQVVLQQVEQEAGLIPCAEQDWNHRIDRLRNYFITTCESKLGLKPNPNLPIRERVYKIQSLLETAEYQDKYEAVHWITMRLLNFDAIYDGYVAEAPTPERFLDTLIRLEREVFQIEHPQPKAHRRACFYIGDPINLRHYLDDYAADRTATIEALTEQLRQTMQDNLNQL
ncbi:1-acyl-sn-glycerol-3-phosphate acyltransferase [Romeria aff. gracilis LEGE 07310]|uniref:1-acyl-sn-glycerol-3-phosphate acyltransferase n=2 Tax=Vasconcelosia TaxID=3366328 RepID=A0A8J7ARL1_9CYAN|nr:1-acyl-sn-glycerol-3-phosphate acyltransferase [Romeria aff. gracilis LEGE 07310]